MINIEYQKHANERDHGEKSLIENIKGDFSEFDRIFYNWDNKNNMDSILLFSQKRQLFKSLDLQTKQISALELSDEDVFREVELYDGKFFCVSIDPVCITIFFDSKSKKFFHKKKIYIANKEKRLREDFRFLIWKQHEQGAVYRCLLGPVEDGRYMNFDLSERFFDAKSEVEQKIMRIFYVSLTLNDDVNYDSHEVICMDEVKKSIICCSKTEDFFEYNGFNQEPSQLLKILYIVTFEYSKLIRMYCYCPYEFFPQKIKNKLKKVARNIKMEMDLETFLKKRYREILLCIKDEYLLKLTSFSENPLSDFEFWRVERIRNHNIFNPLDIVYNDRTGVIYCLCNDGIKILKDSGRNIDEFAKKFDVVENLGYNNFNS